MNRRWVLAQRPEGRLQDSVFARADIALPDLGPDEVRVRVTHLSFDPTQRMWISADSYLPAVPIGAVVRAGGIGQVVASNHPDFKVGQLVQGSFGWQDYLQSTGGTELGPINLLPAGLSPEHALGVLGLTSVTAWFGVHDILKPLTGEVAVVSGAAGATGSAAGQILKAAGARVIGIAGGPEKVRWVKEVAKFDECIDYKHEDVAQRLAQYAPNSVNMVFENVGGAILDASLANLAQRARIALCGGISGYDTGEVHGLKNYMSLVIQRARMEGFLVLDYFPRLGEALQGLGALLARGQLIVDVDMQEGFENIPATLRRLFEGKNRGKQLLKIADPPLPVVN
jgi:NADPH-dependent curcumin reductase CurA